MSQVGMAIDLERCQGCRACLVACKTENDTPRGAFWMNVFRYEEGEFPDVDQGFMPQPCHHCSSPSCADVCPTDARFKRDSDGIVLTDYDTCIGCRYCEIACPYGVNFFQWREVNEGYYGYESTEELIADVESNMEAMGVDPDDVPLSPEDLDDEFDGGAPWSDPTHDDTTVEPRGTKMAGGNHDAGTMGKCTFCVHRQDGDDDSLRGTTACEEVCPIDVIHFGDMEDPDSKPRQYLEEKSRKHQWELLEETGNQSNIVYLGDEPGGDARGMENEYKDPDEAIDAEAGRSMEYLADGGEPQ